MITKETLSKYYKPENFFNREISWLDFNKRVLEEALSPDQLLLDKIKFISIFYSNLDEFYMIRVSGIKEQIRAKVIEPKIDGHTPYEELQIIEREVQKLFKQIHELWINEIIPNLKKNNIVIADIDELTDEERNKLTQYFHKEIYPVLTPLAFDRADRFRIFLI